LKYLGHVIKIQTDSDKVAAVVFVPNFADVVVPMTSLLKKEREWKWIEKQVQARIEGPV